MSKIFISYRRQDSRPVATLIHEPLAKYFEPEFGAGAVFMDVHGIPLGAGDMPASSHDLVKRALGGAY